MKASLKRILSSRKTIFFTALAAVGSLIFAGLIFVLSGAVWFVFLLFSLAVLCTSLSWLSFVFYSDFIIKRQVSPSVNKALYTQIGKIEEILHRDLEEHSERQVNEYKTQTLNTLMKLEQLRLMSYTDAKGSYEK